MSFLHRSTQHGKVTYSSKVAFWIPQRLPDLSPHKMMAGRTRNPPFVFAAQVVAEEPHFCNLTLPLCQKLCGCRTVGYYSPGNYSDQNRREALDLKAASQLGRRVRLASIPRITNAMGRWGSCRPAM